MSGFMTLQHWYGPQILRMQHQYQKHELVFFSYLCVVLSIYNEQSPH